MARDNSPVGPAGEVEPGFDNPTDEELTPASRKPCRVSESDAITVA